MKKSELLRRAKKELGLDRLICMAILMVAENASIREERLLCYELKSWVMGLLLPHTIYEEWLTTNYPKLRTSSHDRHIARLQWIDWMIAYWEKKGQ